MLTLLTEKQAANALAVSVVMLRKWRLRGGGPPFAKLGRSVRYRVQDLEDFAARNLRRSTSDPGKSAA
jgi:hypothetical protein